MPSEEMRMKIRALDQEEAAEQAVEQDRAAEELQNRLRLAGGLPEGIVKTGATIIPVAAPSVDQQDVDLFNKTVERMKANRGFATSLRQELEGLGHLPHPKWFKPVDFFTAKLDFGTSKCTISVASAGAKLRILLSTRMLEIQKTIDGMNAKAAEYKVESEIPLELVSARNKRIEELGVMTDCDIFGSTIVSWDGPIFSWPDHTGQATVKMPLLGSFDLNKADEAEKAAAVYRRIPRKALEMIAHARKILDSFGIEDDFAQGNS